MGCGQTKVVESLANKTDISPTKVVRDLTVEYLGGLLMPQNPASQADTVGSSYTYFDDLDALKQARSMRIECLTIFYSQYINGLEVSYYIEDVLKTITHSRMSGKKARVDFFVNEAIASMHCTYSEKGIHSIRIVTTDGRKVEALGSIGQGVSSEEASVSKEREIVGFRGAFGKHLVYQRKEKLWDSEGRLGSI